MIDDDFSAAIAIQISLSIYESNYLLRLNERKLNSLHSCRRMHGNAFFPILLTIGNCFQHSASCQVIFLKCTTTRIFLSIVTSNVDSSSDPSRCYILRTSVGSFKYLKEDDENISFLVLQLYLIICFYQPVYINWNSIVRIDYT